MGKRERKIEQVVRKETRKNYKYLREEIGKMSFFQRCKFAYILVFKTVKKDGRK